MQGLPGRHVDHYVECDLAIRQPLINFTNSPLCPKRSEHGFAQKHTTSAFSETSYNSLGSHYGDEEWIPRYGLWVHLCPRILQRVRPDKPARWDEQQEPV